MGSIGDSFTPNVPAVGSSGTQYATDVNEVLDELITRVSSPVPLSALGGGTLDLNNSGITDAQYVAFQNQTSAPSGSPLQRLVAYNGELYWVGNSGAVKVTSGSTLNAAALGGFTGNYGSGGEQARYVTADTRYDFYSDYATTTWGYVRARGFDIAAGATSALYARLQFGGASSLTFTLPATLPAANRSVLVVNAAGQIAFGDATNTIQNDTYHDGNIVLNGTNQLKHGSRTLVVPILVGQYSAGVHSAVASSGEIGVRVTTLGIYRMAISGLQVNWRLKSFVARLNKAGVTATTVAVYKFNPSTGTNASIGSNTSIVSGRTTISHTFGAPETVNTDEIFIVQWSGGDVNDILYCIELDYDVV